MGIAAGRMGTSGAVSCFCRYKDNPEALKNMQNVEFFNSFKEIVLTAERSLLYALGFQLDIRHPYYWSTTILNRLGSLPSTGQPWDGPWWQEYQQKTVSRQHACKLKHI